MNIAFEISGDAKKRLDNAAKKSPGGIRNAVKRATAYMWGKTQEKTPVGFGNLRKSMSYTVSGFEGRVRPTVNYALAVHEGTKPHHVPRQEWANPSGSLYRWATRKGLNPFAVARSIAKKGTKPNPWMRRSFDAHKDEMGKFFEEAVDKILR